MVVDRAHEIRIIAEPREPNTVAAVRPVVKAALGPDWRVQRLVPRSRLVLIRGRSEHVVASQQHARDSHEAALRLRESGRFVKVEADLLFTEIELYSKRWKLAQFEYGSGLRLGAKFPIHYIEGQPFDVSIDDIEFQVPDIDPMQLLSGLIDQIA